MPDQQTAHKMALDAQIAFAQVDDRYTAAFTAFNRLNANGWNLTIFEASAGTYYMHGRGTTMIAMSGPHLCVSGTDNHGDGLSGTIDARGNLSGSPLD